MPPLALKSFYSASFFCGRQLCLWWCLASHKPPFMSILPVGDKSGLSSFWRRCVHQIFPFHVFTAVFPADVECPALSLISFCSLVDVSLSALVRRPLLIYNTENSTPWNQMKYTSNVRSCVHATHNDGSSHAGKKSAQLTPATALCSLFCQTIKFCTHSPIIIAPLHEILEVLSLTDPLAAMKQHQRGKRIQWCELAWEGWWNPQPNRNHDFTRLQGTTSYDDSIVRCEGIKVWQMSTHKLPDSPFTPQESLFRCPIWLYRPA